MHKCALCMTDEQPLVSLSDFARFCLPCAAEIAQGTTLVFY